MCATKFHAEWSDREVTIFYMRSNYAKNIIHKITLYIGIGVYFPPVNPPTPPGRRRVRVQLWPFLHNAFIRTDAWATPY